MSLKILIAEDDSIFRNLVCDIIESQDYTPVEASNGQEAIDIFFNSNDIDMVILDVMMPIYNGWEVLKDIREHSDIPIIMLTALGDETHEALGLNKGADEYISKPFSFEVFIARLNNIAKKIRKNSSNELSYGNIKINQNSHKVMCHDLEIKLNPKEYSLLIYLIKNSGNVLTRDMILNNVWGYDFDGDARTIDTHVKTLRAKLASEGKYIKTVRGTGYMIEGC
ncbi:MAG: response regulator transcription factor [Clostridium sp.]|nr:response regulator transcription factor [Clostridium sp.]